MQAAAQSRDNRGGGARAGTRRAFWLKQLHQWHWISSALCLVGMLLFAITGFTLNHAGQIEAKAQTIHRNAQLPTALLHVVAGEDERKGIALPTAVADWVSGTLGVDVAGREGDWSSDEIYLSMPRPGGDAWLSIDRETGKVEYERSSRGVIAYLNDLHKGRHAGPAWGWFIDVFALACVIFSVTGLLLLKMHAAQRGATWPLVAFGLVLPLVLALIFIH
ncbi:PepSY-associated TM helix domain-containing protein [Dyella sp. C9]|uniref:PepSY-associated TM helix domain-containing protein n=1 Tax=Dyella sp. C9 TaxID=2202154 RepID=UPI000DEFB5C9|nr:PepSY-associated TM helix domain-containing protein [Dyella sp. C9]